jgi:hypothetical protein
MKGENRYLLLQGEERVPAVMMLGLPVEATAGRLIYSDRSGVDTYLLPPEGKKAEDLTSAECSEYSVRVYPGIVRKTYDRSVAAQEVEHYFS